MNDSIPKAINTLVLGGTGKTGRRIIERLERTGRRRRIMGRQIG